MPRSVAGWRERAAAPLSALPMLAYAAGIVVAVVYFRHRQLMLAGVLVLAGL